MHALGFGLSIAETDARARLIETGFRFLTTANVSMLNGAGWLWLVASPLVHGVPNILSLNDRDFARYARITAVHPRKVVEAG